MPRASWKSPYTSVYLDELLKEKHTPADARAIIQDRAMVVPPGLIGQTVHVTNGLRFVPLAVTEQHVGYKFGAFAATKKRARPKSRKS